ncbi:unnamed protein product [Urochloa humidicola]
MSTSDEISEDESITVEEPSRQAEVKVVHGQTTLAYSIGDVVSFAGFIAALRRIVPDDDPVYGRRDILDSHYDSNLSSTRQHPMLTSWEGAIPNRCLHVHLQVSGEEETSSATLILRYDNLYS